MAKRIKNITPNTGGPAAKYPWDNWLNGEAWLLETGKDYQCKDQSMRYQIRHQAKQRGLVVTIQKAEGGLQVQATKPRQKRKKLINAKKSGR